jgi:hypothetical protein
LGAAAVFVAMKALGAREHTGCAPTHAALIAPAANKVMSTGRSATVTAGTASSTSSVKPKFAFPP